MSFSNRKLERNLKYIFSILTILCLNIFDFIRKYFNCRYGVTILCEVTVSKRFSVPHYISLARYPFRFQMWSYKTYRAWLLKNSTVPFCLPLCRLVCTNRALHLSWMFYSEVTWCVIACSQIRNVGCTIVTLISIRGNKIRDIKGETVYKQKTNCLWSCLPSCTVPLYSSPYIIPIWRGIIQIEKLTLAIIVLKRLQTL